MNNNSKTLLTLAFIPVFLISACGKSKQTKSSSLNQPSINEVRKLFSNGGTLKGLSTNENIELAEFDYEYPENTTSLPFGITIYHIYQNNKFKGVSAQPFKVATADLEIGESYCSLGVKYEKIESYNDLDGAFHALYEKTNFPVIENSATKIPYMYNKSGRSDERMEGAVTISIEPISSSLNEETTLSTLHCFWAQSGEEESKLFLDDIVDEAFNGRIRLELEASSSH